jgi:uncharacterized protein
MLYKSFQFVEDTKARGAEGKFSGRASVYGVVDLGGDVVLPGAFTKTLVESAGKIVILNQHKHEQSIGMGILNDSPEALLIQEAQLELELTDAKQAWIRLTKGLVTGLSIGYSVPEGGYYYERGVRFLKEIALHEVSLVTFPMNTHCGVTDAKSMESAEEQAKRLLSLVEEIKAGRMLSAGNLALVKECHGALAAAHAKLAELIAAAEPGETEAEKAAREEAEGQAAAAAQVKSSYEELLAGIRQLATK